MHSCPTNNNYGHAEVYKSYVDVDVNMLIKGRLQHGWSAEYAGVVAEESFKGNYYVWNEKSGKFGRDFDGKINPLPTDRVFVVGSPILYYEEGVKEVDYDDLLFISKHSLRAKLVSDKDWIRFIKYVKSTAADGTILISQRDLDLGRGKLIEDSGLYWECAGRPDLISFFPNLIEILSSFTSVIATNAQTALFYALYIGKWVMIDGPNMDTGDYCERFVLDKSWTKEKFPELLKGTDDKNIADWELGLEFKKSKEDLKRIMF